MYRLEEILKNKDISKSEFAKMLGITKQSIPNLLKGNPTKARLEEMAKILGIPTWQLFVDPEDVYNEVSPREPDFTALIKDGNEQYSASSLDELEELIKKLRSKRIDIDKK